MATAWQLQVAKNRLSEVVERAVSQGAQEITKHGRHTAVVLSYREYQRLRRRRGTLLDFFQRSPLRGLELTRNKDLPRKVDL